MHRLAVGVEEDCMLPARVAEGQTLAAAEIRPCDIQVALHKRMMMAQTPVRLARTLGL